jgi:predicted kinase
VSECVILVGLPGAGKTTFYRERFASTHRHVSKDLWPNAQRRDARQQRILDEALAAGESVVVDNTNPSKKDRAALIAIARARHARVVGYFFDVSTREAVARNAARAGREKVPSVAIFTTAKRLEPPTLEEGFDQLFHVRLTLERTLDVQDVTAAAPTPASTN